MSRIIVTTEFTGTDYEALEREAQEVSQYIWAETGTVRTFYNRYDDMWLVLNEHDATVGREWASLDAAIEGTLAELDLEF